MRILVIGGSGLIGGAVAQEAVRLGRDVAVVSRGDLQDELKESSCRHIRGDWYDDAFARSVTDNEFYDVIVDALVFDQAQLIRSVSLAEGHCSHYFYISTDSVYEHPNDMVTEDAHINDSAVKWSYGVKKREAELYLNEHSSDCSFGWTVIRPTVTFGKTRLPVGFASKRNTFNLCARILDDKPVIRFDDPSSRHAVCHSSIFGKAVNSLFLNEASFSEFYHISDDNAYTYQEIFEAIEHALGKKGSYVFMPSDRIKEYSGFIYEDMVYDKDPSFTLDNSKIKAVCPDISFHADLDEVIGMTVRHLEANKYSKPQDPEYDYLTDELLIRYRGTHEAEEYVNGLSEEYIKETSEHSKSIKRREGRLKVRMALGRIKRKILH